MTNTATKNKFSSFNLKDYIVSALSEINFTNPTEIQKNVIPIVLAGKNVVASSETGSGKTHSFLVPLFNNIDNELKSIQAIIIEPSRELTSQIEKMFRQLNNALPKEKQLDFYNLTGKSIDNLFARRDKPQIVVGTPNQISKLTSRGKNNFPDAKTLVIDESDTLLDMGFIKDVETIILNTPSIEQKLLFSATFKKPLEIFVKKNIQKNFERINHNKNQISNNVENVLISTKSKENNEVIYNLLTRKNTFITLVFANTKKRAAEIATYLRDNGLKVGELHGNLTPRQRKRFARELKDLRYNIIVASDLAARGLDIEGIDEVINDDIPNNSEFFVHRVGRTGRNNESGTSITLFQPGKEEKVKKIESLGIKFKRQRLSKHQLVDEKEVTHRKRLDTGFSNLDDNKKGKILSSINKKKKNIKPGYKKKIQKMINVDTYKKR